MKKYNHLLEEVAGRYNIKQGRIESDENYKTRIVYSICSLMAYSSLWDEADEAEEGIISITHLKKRIKKVFLAYRELYPEIFANTPVETVEMENEICDIFINTGVVYHAPNRIAPSRRREISYRNIVFQRGIFIDDIHFVSGAGMYSTTFENNNSSDLRDMFCLPETPLINILEILESSANWYVSEAFDSSTEYLKLNPPFRKGYWNDRPDGEDVVSLLRTGMKGSQIYYLYRLRDEGLEVSQLPYWRTEKYNYRDIANALLLKYNTLPPIEYEYDGDIVNIYLNYLLPPRELNFLKLYSWPYSCNSLPSDFKRICSSDVFIAIKDVLQEIGFSFNKR